LAEYMPGADLPAPPRLCPHCGGRRILRWGFFRGSQRYRCRQCSRTFNALTGTPYARLRSAELWLDYRAAVVAQLSIRRAADRCGISVATALRWRRRIGPVPEEEVETAARPEGASPSKLPPELPERGVLDFVEWVHAASAIDDGQARRERLQGLFGGDGAEEK
jgi:transposase-like protein